MRFKIDENLPVDVANLLRGCGHDATTVHEQNLNGTFDQSIAMVCQIEERVLITLDMDFANILAYPPSSYEGIVVLRVVQQHKDHVLHVIRGILPLLDAESVRGCLWIVEENGLRIRQ